MNRSLLIFIFLISLPCYPQSDSEFQERLILPLKEARKNQLKQQEKNYHKYRDRTNLKAIRTSPKIHIFVKKGTLLYDTRKQIHRTTARDIFTEVHSLPDEWNEIYLADKDNVLRYKIQSKDLISLKEDLDMTNGPTRFVEEYRPVVVKEDQIKKNYQLLAYFDQVKANATSKLTGDKSSGTGKRLEFSRYFQTAHFPLSWGILGQYEDSKIGAHTQRKSWGMGMSLKTKEVETGFIPIIIGVAGTFGEAKSTSSNAASTIPTITSQQITIQPFVEMHFDSFFGKYLIGANYRQQWIKTSYQQSSNNYQNDQSYGLYLGLSWN